MSTSTQVHDAAAHVRAASGDAVGWVLNNFLVLPESPWVNPRPDPSESCPAVHATGCWYRDRGCSTSVRFARSWNQARRLSQIVRDFRSTRLLRLSLGHSARGSRPQSRMGPVVVRSIAALTMVPIIARKVSTAARRSVLPQPRHEATFAESAGESSPASGARCDRSPADRRSSWSAPA